MAPAAPDSSTNRSLICARCGTSFECRPGGGCWCADEPYRLPLPPEIVAADCLCPTCLRAAAARRPYP